MSQISKRYLSHGEDATLAEVSFHQYRVGSQFFILTQRHAKLVVQDRRLWRKFRLPCVTEEPCYPEEHYFLTLMSMEDPNGCNRFILTRVNWTGCWDGDPHLYNPRSCWHLFARKFSPECLEPLMNIADDVIFRDK